MSIGDLHHRTGRHIQTLASSDWWAWPSPGHVDLLKVPCMRRLTDQSTPKLSALNIPFQTAVVVILAYASRKLAKTESV